MAKCAKCNTELGFAAKFCAVCGTAREAPESEGFVPPLSQVNPFAATASPNSKNPIAPVPDSVVISGLSSADAPPTKESGAPSPSRPPSRPPLSVDGSPVSPLAVSGALSQRGAFQQAVASAKSPSITPPPAPERPAAKKPGTQMMPNAPSRPGAPSTGEPDLSARPSSLTPQPPNKPVARTVAMNANMLQRPNAVPQPQPSPVPGTAQPVAQSAPAAQPAPAAVAQPAPAAVAQPAPAAQTGSPFANNYAQQQPPQSAYGQPPANAQQQQPQSAYGQPPANAQQPAAWGWSTPNAAQPQAGAAYGGHYSVSYFPGSRVQVTWSNGQRYPATVSQVTGSQCLVVFPDGQQHWVEMMYLTPG